MEEYKKMQQSFLDENNEPIQMGVNDNLEKLKALFPSVVKDGFVDFKALKEELGEIEEVGVEKYNLTWLGKQGAKIEAQTSPVGKTLNFKENGNVNFKGETENLYIEGDNLEVLKLLKENYYGKIKMIYIDPPYNTGKDFVYKDNFHMSAEESDKVEGLVNEDGDRLESRFKENSKGNRYHSNWLNMMYPRLKVAHSLLKDDGVIFISIDDNEVHNLRKICDEIFGEDNFIGQWNWFKSATPPNLSHKIKKNIEYILCYEKIKDNYKYAGVKKESKSSDPMTKPQNTIKQLEFPKGSLIFKGKDGVYSKGIYGTEKFPNTLLGDMIIKDGTNVNKVVFENKFIWLQVKLDEELENNTAMFLSKDLVLSYKKSEYDNEVPPNFIDKLVGVGTTEKAGQSLDKLFSANKIYDFPKDISLLKYLINFKCGPNDIILDFFSGSATTAHAIMQLNAENGYSRKFILVQIQEEIDVELEAFKKGCKNICELGKQRIRFAGDEVLKDLHVRSENNIANNMKNVKTVILLNEDSELDEQIIDKDKYIKNPELLDIGFKVFEVGKTNIKWNEVESLEEIIELEEVYLKGKDKFDFMPHFTDENVVYEIALQHRGVPLSSSLEQLSDIGERTYLYANSYLVCLEEDITEEIIKKISKISPQPIAYYFRDSAFGENIALKDDTLRTFRDLVSINYGNNKGSYTLEFI